MTGPATVLTIGHSTRTLGSFISLLEQNAAAVLVDIRTVPRSRHNPQFNRETLPGALEPAGIGYRHVAGLGGLRRPRPDSPNTGWRNAAFRGYADYMLTPDFAENLRLMIDLAGRERICLMCAEAVPWRCHRLLVSDALTVRGIRVEHIISEAARQPHTLTTWATVEGERILYPAQAGSRRPGKQ